MKSHKVASGYILVLQKDERLVKSITDFCKANKIGAGFITGLGAVQSATVGYYFLKSQRYRFKRIQRLMEIASLSGTVSLRDGQPFLHLHTVLSDGKLRPLAGHLKEATVGGTCEVYLQVFSGQLIRQLDEETGLYLIS